MADTPIVENGNRTETETLIADNRHEWHEVFGEDNEFHKAVPTPDSLK